MGSKKVDSKHKLIGFKAFLDRDEDIVVWWELMPPGERSHVLRSLIRAFLHGQVVTIGEAPTAFSRSVQIAQVQADTRWIKDALLDLPDYLEDLLSRTGRAIVQNIPVSAMPTQPVPSPKVAMPPAPKPSVADLSENEADLRASRILKTKW
jgi:hypothetical protein